MPEEYIGRRKDRNSTFRQYSADTSSENTYVVIEVYKFNDFIESAIAAETFSESRRCFVSGFAYYALTNVTRHGYVDEERDPAGLSTYGGLGQGFDGVHAFAHHFGFSSEWLNRHIGTITEVEATKQLNAPCGTFGFKCKVGIPSVDRAHSSAISNQQMFQREYDMPHAGIHAMMDEGDYVVISTHCGARRRQSALADDESAVTGAPSDESSAYLGWETVMVGRIDTVEVEVGINSEGAPEYDVSVKGRDFQGVLQDVPLYFNPMDPMTNNADGRIMAEILSANQTISGDAVKVIQTVLSLSGEAQAMLGYPPLVPTGSSRSETSSGDDVGDLGTATVRDSLMLCEVHESASEYGNHFAVPFWFCLNTEHMHPTYGYIHAWDLMTPGEYTPLFQLAQRYQNPEYNELWMDTYAHECPLPYDIDGGAQTNPRKLRIIYREKPFENLKDREESPWFKLATHPIHTNRIESISGMRGGNRLNHIQVTVQMPAFLGLDQTPLLPPIYCPASIERWGLKRKIVETPLFTVPSAEPASTTTEGSEGNVSSTATELEEFRDKYAHWNLLAPYYYTGRIQTAGIFAEIRPGVKIRIDHWELASFAGNAPFAQMLADDIASHEQAMNAVKDEKDRLKYGTWQGDEREYFTAYVDSVSWSWSYSENPSMTTTVTYSRGYIDKLRIPHMERQWMLWGSTMDPSTWSNASEPRWSDPTLPEDLDSSNRDYDDVYDVVPTDDEPETGYA